MNVCVALAHARGQTSAHGLVPGLSRRWRGKWTWQAFSDDAGLCFKSSLACDASQAKRRRLHALFGNVGATVDTQTINLVGQSLQGEIDVLKLRCLAFIDGKFHIALVIALSLIVLDMVKVCISRLCATDFAVTLLFDACQQLVAHHRQLGMYTGLQQVECHGCGSLG